ncbi:hypothetical protein CSC2_07430 [Clostridium zeae]|uniref:Uncharacterized protein n=1 Tax=Clostridium zeae TaxID=2759022 RepID=A0ABQ1E630_9CLOT|nr:hypothetical protein [Clostridium zeae]GFZ30217.1 hypothetical protein CSC2_07430 [Clostridium zeae]
MVDEKIIEAFHMMWDNFPGSVRLIHKNRTVLAVNEIARQNGFEVGVMCIKIGSPEIHRGCKANVALSTKKAQIGKLGEDRIRYWIPVTGYDDIYIHFSIDTKTVQL